MRIWRVMWLFLPWEQRTFERVQRTAERGRPAADRRASWRSVAIKSPNCARSKIQSELPELHRSTNYVSGRSRRCLKTHSGPCENVSVVEKSLLVYFTLLLLGFVCQTICADTLLISGSTMNPPPCPWPFPLPRCLPFSHSTIRLLFSAPPPSTFDFVN